MNELALFAGAGGGILGGKLLGWRTVCAVELDPYCRRVLLARQRDGFLPRFPIWDNVTTFDGKPWRGRADLVSGAFPCQGVSAAKSKGTGLNDHRSGLWREMARIIGEVRPRFAFVENSPMLTRRGLGTVLGDLASLGYNARWGVLGANRAGLPIKRERMWIVAFAHGGQQQNQPDRLFQMGRLRGAQENTNNAAEGRMVRRSKSRLGRVIPNGVAGALDRNRAIGNGQCPAVVRLAWHLLGGAA
jgi:DNA (cytosine-5)-methyltransferase 1